MTNDINYNTLQNILLENGFNIKSLKNGLGNFQFVDSLEKLGLLSSDTTITPQIIFNHMPETSVVSVDTPANNDWAMNANGHLWAFSGKFDSVNNRSLPVYCVWINKQTNAMYQATYNGNGSLFKWYPINIASPTSVSTITTAGGSTFKYRIVMGNLLEFEVNTANEKFSTQTTIGTIDYIPKLDNAYFPLTMWSNDETPTGINAVRITTYGNVQLICNDKYVHGHGMFAIYS